jgi:hypothetical protein
MWYIAVHGLPPYRVTAKRQIIKEYCWSQWQSGLRTGCEAARLLGLRVRIPPVAWMSLSCERCVLSDSGLCEGPITRLEKLYRMWRVCV